MHCEQARSQVFEKGWHPLTKVALFLAFLNESPLFFALKFLHIILKNIFVSFLRENREI